MKDEERDRTELSEGSAGGRAERACGEGRKAALPWRPLCELQPSGSPCSKAVSGAVGEPGCVSWMPGLLDVWGAVSGALSTLTTEIGTNVIAWQLRLRAISSGLEFQRAGILALSPVHQMARS